MAVSHKTNNLINCNRCHLPFNFKNTAPKMLSCKQHWYCFNCLEHLTTHIVNNTQLRDAECCLQCQKSIEIMRSQKVVGGGGQQQHQQYENKKIQNIINNNTSINFNYNNNNKSDNNNTLTTFGCEDDLAQKDFENFENGNKTRSASLNSENSLGSFGYFNNNSNNINNKINDLDINLHLRSQNCINTSSVTEKMLPGENCFIHGMPNTLWCQTCLTVLCRGCNAGAEHKDHKVENQLEAKEFYQNRVKQEFVQIQVSVEEMENLKHLQKGFLLKLLETCCTLKLQIEHELVVNSNNGDIDEMKDTMKNLQLCFALLGKQTPHEILKLYKVIKDENCKFKLKHKQMMQQCKMQQLLTKSQRILDFDLLKEILQKIDSSNSTPGDLNKTSDNWFNDPESVGRESNNSIMILTNYCIYRLYMSYMRQQQQFIEQQFMRYQQYHQEQKQNLIKQFKMLQQHASQQQDSLATINNTANVTSTTTTNEFSTFFSQDKDKPKTYAEIATIQNAHQFDSNENSNGFDLITTTSNNFQPYKKPLTKSSYEEPRKTVQLLFNPINNENNQIYFFDFERNGLHMGRVLIKVFADIAPKMSYNFHALATHEKGFGYSGCKVFECHPNESIITGDIEQNTGYSSRSIYEDVQFIPDDTNITPFPGAVGMRRAKKKFDSQGLVGSQFRIILTELGFTAIFGCVIEGLEVVKKISQTLVQNDKIHGSAAVAGIGGSNGSLNNVNNGVVGVVGSIAGIFIAQCGLYEFVKRDIMCGI